jgi:hypothetical protein
MAYIESDSGTTEAELKFFRVMLHARPWTTTRPSGLRYNDDDHGDNDDIDVHAFLKVIEQEHRKVHKFYQLQAKFFTECVMDLVQLLLLVFCWWLLLCAVSVLYFCVCTFSQLQEKFSTECVIDLVLPLFLAMCSGWLSALRCFYVVFVCV